MKIYIKVSENNKTLTTGNRWNSFSKDMILKKCWISLQMNLTAEDSVQVFHHDLSESTLEWLNTTSQAGLINFTKVSSVEENFKISLDQLYADIGTNLSQLYAYIEDDFLWAPGSIKLIKETSEYWKSFIIPNDSSINYLEPKFSHVYIGKDRHWRSATRLEWTLIGNGATFIEYKDNLYDAIYNDLDKNILQSILHNTECLLPLPGIATHCKDNNMTPLVDWWYIWNGIKL